MGSPTWNDFGLLEAIFSLWVVVLMAAAIFYQVSKFIARTDRQDPLYRFYRVFWAQFFSGVTPMEKLDLALAESYARAAGHVPAGEMTDDQFEQLDAPELVNVGSTEVQQDPRHKSVTESGEPTARSIGRTGSEKDNLLRPERDTESREAKFLKEQKQKPAPTAPIAAAPPKKSFDDSGAHKTAVSTLDVRVIPSSPQDQIVGVQTGELVIRLVYAPEDGRANGAIIELVAKQLNIRPYQISLLRGHYKLRKTLQIAGLDPAALAARLR